MTIAADYTGHDFYCDVAIPNAASLRTVHDDDVVLAYHHTRQDSKHLHIHVHSGPQTGDEVRRAHPTRPRDY